jgi:tetratricopeptide (TPR) repeat protein
VASETERNRNRKPRRAYTPEERRAIERRRRAERERARHRDNAVIAVVAISAVTVISLCIWYFSYVQPNDNYDAQMSTGVERFNEKQYTDAESAFLKALMKRPNDAAAMIALADTYAVQGRYDEAIREMKALQGVDDEDTRTYDRLITWYVEKTRDIASANEQILAAYELKLSLSNPLVQPAPVFDPKPGEFGEATKISIKTLPGFALYYSTDGSVPKPGEGERYVKKISLTNNNDVTYRAVAYDGYGFMSWPAEARYSLAIKYGVDDAALKYLGATAKEIMESVGPLYYDSQHEEGYYYYDESKEFYYVFANEYFVVESESTSVTTDGAVQVQTSMIDAEREPLPPDAVCAAVSMKISDYIVQMKGGIAVDDLMAGVGIEEYDVERDAQDGKYHLIYESDGARYDMTMKNRDTVTRGGVLMIYAAQG